jgi:hypothetical protein
MKPSSSFSHHPTTTTTTASFSSSTATTTGWKSRFKSASRSNQPSYHYPQDGSGGAVNDSFAYHHHPHLHSPASTAGRDLPPSAYTDPRSPPKPPPTGAQHGYQPSSSSNAFLSAAASSLRGRAPSTSTTTPSIRSGFSSHSNNSFGSGEKVPYNQPHNAMPASNHPFSVRDDDDEAECPVCLEPLSFSFRLPGEKPHIVPECGHALHEVRVVYIRAHSSP